MSEGRRRVPVPAVVLLVVVLTAGVLATTVFAADPTSGTVSLEDPILDPWQGESYAIGAPVTPFTCELPGDETCDEFQLTVDIPAVHWETNKGGVDIRTEADPASGGDDDFDIQVLNNEGDVVTEGQGANAGGATERVFIENANREESPYRIQVAPYEVSNSDYMGGAFVDSRAIAGAGAAVPQVGRVGSAECPESGTGRAAGIFPCDDVDLDSFLSIPEISPDGENADEQLNDIWGWTDDGPGGDGDEYALVGKTNGTAFVNVTDAANPVYLGDLPTNTPMETIFNTWRDIKVYKDHAYVVSEEPTHGMQVFDLRRLRGVDEAREDWDADFDYSFVARGPLSLTDPPDALDRTPLLTGDNAHNIAINEDSGFAYAIGTSTCAGGGAHVIDLGNPNEFANDDPEYDPAPTFDDCISDDSYTHDTQCVEYNGPDKDHTGEEICLSSNEDSLTIHQVADADGARIEPKMLSRTEYEESAYTHQGWLTSDGRHFLVGDELDEQADPGIPVRTLIFDVTNLDGNGLPMGDEAASLDPPKVSDGRTESIDHNLYTVDNPATFQNAVFQSNYRSGLRVLDSSGLGSGQLRETGCFDVFPADNEPEFNGSWSNYPYFDSGNVIASGIEEGLFVLSPDPEDSDDSTGCPDDSAETTATSPGADGSGEGDEAGGGSQAGNPSCFAAASRARAKRLGRAGLGNRRSNVRKTFGADGRYRRFLDRYCLSDGSTIRVGYPSPKGLRPLVERERNRLRGKASLVLTSSRQSTLRAVNVGDSVRELLDRTGRRKGVRVGKNVWFVRRGSRAGHVFKVQDGIVREVGLADRKQTATSGRVKRFFTSER